MPNGAVAGAVVPGGYEEWFAGFIARRQDRRWRDRQKRKHFHTPANRLCWHCKYRLIAQGKSVSQRYARENKLCIGCYSEGVRKGTP